MKTVRVLVVFANPPGTEQLLFDKEYSMLKLALAGSQVPANVSVDDLPAARADELWTRVGSYRPHIVHFICHGNEQGELLLYDNEQTSAEPLDVDHLANMIHIHQDAQIVKEDRIRLIVMTGCWTAQAAAKLVQYVDIALGFCGRVQVDAIVNAFAYRLYASLVNGDSMDAATKAAREAMTKKYGGDAQMLRMELRIGIDPEKYVFIAHRAEVGESVALDILLKSARELRQKRHERDGLEGRLIEYEVKLGKSDITAKRELQEEIDRHEAELKRLDDAIDELRGKLINEVAHAGAGSELQRRLIQSWQNTAHQIDYEPTLEPIKDLLDDIADGGRAFFVIPQQSRMYSEWLLKRIREWAEQDRHCEYRVRHLVLNLLDVNYVVGELCTQFAVRSQRQVNEPAEDLLQQLAENIVRSGAGNQVVLALELSIKLPNAAPASIFGFLRWLLDSVCTKLETERALQQTQGTSLRLLIFVLTDLDLLDPPAGLFADVSTPSPDGCLMTRVALWQSRDVERWLLKYSRLIELGSAPQTLKACGVHAHGEGQGIPRWVWSQLVDNMNNELNARLEALDNARIAALRV